MKKAIIILERKQRRLHHRITRKFEWIKKQIYSTPETNEAKIWIKQAKEEIKELEKALFYIKQAEENLNKPPVIEETTN
jgi:hypothetical protein